jgi:hypothetical protein
MQTQQIIQQFPHSDLPQTPIRPIRPKVKESLSYRRELAKLWKEEGVEFNQLKRLARAIGIEGVFVSPSSASLDLKGWYVYCGWEVDSMSAREWGLSKEQIHSINRKEGPVILIDYHSCAEQGASRTLSHEIGHHLYRLAKFKEDEQSTPVTETMKGFFPHDEYLHQSRDEICAECFAEYLTVPTTKSGIKRHCDSILRKVRVHNPNAAKLIESYRGQIAPELRKI